MVPGFVLWVSGLFCETARRITLNMDDNLSMGSRHLLVRINIV